MQKTHLLAPLQLLRLIFLLNLNPHASSPTRPADTFLCGWADTQTKLLWSAMWKIPSTEVKRNPETEPSYESGSATQFSREAGDPVTSSQNSFHRETADIRVEDLEICRRDKRNRNVPLNRLKLNRDNLQAVITYIVSESGLFTAGWPGHQIIIFLFIVVHFWLRCL